MGNSEDDKPAVQKAVEGIDTVRGILNAGPEKSTAAPTARNSPEALDREHLVKRGCTPKLAAILVLLGVTAAVLTFVGMRADDACGATLAKGCAAPTSAPASDGETTSSAASATTATTAAPAVSKPPTSAQLPPGAILYQGVSGGQIGCIACDGQSRFLSITGPGVGVGNAAGVAAAIPWDRPGHVVSFGATLHTSTNKGRYGVAVFRNVPATPAKDSPYRAGCAIEVGAKRRVAPTPREHRLPRTTRSRSSWARPAPAPVPTRSIGGSCSSQTRS